MYYIIIYVLSRYKLIKEVGNGTFGSVWRAINKQTGEVVRTHSEDDFLPIFHLKFVFF